MWGDRIPVKVLCCEQHQKKKKKGGGGENTLRRERDAQELSKKGTPRCHIRKKDCIAQTLREDYLRGKTTKEIPVIKGDVLIRESASSQDFSMNRNLTEHHVEKGEKAARTSGNFSGEKGGCCMTAPGGCKGAPS